MVTKKLSYLNCSSGRKYMVLEDTGIPADSEAKSTRNQKGTFLKSDGQALGSENTYSKYNVPTDRPYHLF